MKRSIILVVVLAGCITLYYCRKDTTSVSENGVKGVGEIAVAEQQKPSSPQAQVLDSNAERTEERVSPLENPPIFRSGTLELGLEFEDTSLSQAQAYRISEDLNGVFSHLNAKFKPFEAGKRLIFEGEGRITPEPLEVMWMIQEVEGEQFLSVPQTVSDAYSKAFEFIQKENIRESEVQDLLDPIQSGKIGAELIASLVTPVVGEEPLSELAEERRSSGNFPPHSFL